MEQTSISNMTNQQKELQIEINNAIDKVVSGLSHPHIVRQELYQRVVKLFAIPDVSARYSLKDMEQIFFAGYFHPPIKNDETEEGLDTAFKAVIDRHDSNVR